MNTITQITTRRQAVIRYAEKKGVTAAARRYNVGRATIYRWKERYDGTLYSRFKTVLIVRTAIRPSTRKKKSR